MSKPTKKPAPQTAAARSSSSRPNTAPASLNPRLIRDLRWQRGKRYNWDGR